MHIECVFRTLVQARSHMKRKREDVPLPPPPPPPPPEDALPDWVEWPDALPDWVEWPGDDEPDEDDSLDWRSFDWFVREHWVLWLFPGDDGMYSSSIYHSLFEGLHISLGRNCITNLQYETFWRDEEMELCEGAWGGAIKVFPGKVSFCRTLINGQWRGYVLCKSCEMYHNIIQLPEIIDTLNFHMTASTNMKQVVNCPLNPPC